MLLSTTLTSQIVDTSPRSLSHPDVIKRIALAYGSNYLHTFLLILRDPIDRAFSHCIDAELRLAYMIDSTLHNMTAFERYEALYKGFDKHGFAHCSCLLVHYAL